MIRLEPQARKKLTSSNVIAPMQTGNPLSEMFHENTKMGRITGAVYHSHIASLTRSPVLREVLKQPCKIYSLNEAVALDTPSSLNDVELHISSRRSERQFTGQPVSLATLSRLLHFSYGVTDSRRGFRAVPSAGALYPLELYVVSRQVSGLDPGLYHYNASNHALDVVNHQDVWPSMHEVVGFHGANIDGIAAVVVITAIFRRMTLKYLDRGYRMILFEVGAVAQNLALVADSLGVGSCAFGGFQDDNLAAVLGIDGIDEAPLLPIALGMKTDADGDGQHTAMDW